MMKRLGAALLLVLFAFSPAVAMTRAGAPAKFQIPWGNSAGNAYITYPIPQSSQIGIKNCAASLTDGEPPLTMQSASSGGCAPFGQDLNGIFKQITQWNQQTQMGAVPAYDSAFSSSIGGYPEGTILSQASAPECFWVSQADNNTSDPDTGGANWTSTCPGGGIASAASTGSANAQVVSATPFILGANVCVGWVAGYTNTGTMQINVNGAGLVNLYTQGQSGPQAMVAGEVQLNANEITCWDGTRWELVNRPGTMASLARADQTLSGGANVTSDNLGTITTGTVTIDCGARPLQYLTDGGTFTIAAPANDGSCMLLIINTTGAVVPTFSGFTVNSNTGEPFDTTSGHKFIVTIVEIDGIATWLNKSLQ